MRRFDSLDALAACVGQDVAVSDWVEVGQAQVEAFADATGDRQWIHVDPVRAAQGPFGGPIAHGFLTLSLLPAFFDSALALPAQGMGVNYGLNRVRFTAPVPVGSRVRAHMHLLAAEALAPVGWQFTWSVQVEREGQAKPVCVAEALVRRYP